MKIKPGICVALLCVLCLGLGMAAGYGLAVYAGNNAHSADSDLLCAGGLCRIKMVVARARFIPIWQI